MKETLCNVAAIFMDIQRGTQMKGDLALAAVADTGTAARTAASPATSRGDEENVLSKSKN